MYRYACVIVYKLNQGAGPPGRNHIYIYIYIYIYICVCVCVPLLMLVPNFAFVRCPCHIGIALRDMTSSCVIVVTWMWVRLEIGKPLM